MTDTQIALLLVSFMLSLPIGMICQGVNLKAIYVRLNDEQKNVILLLGAGWLGIVLVLVGTIIL